MDLARFGELQRKGVETTVAYFNAIFQYSLEAMRKTTQNY
jgi:hypothetical protein